MQAITDLQKCQAEYEVCARDHAEKIVTHISALINTQEKKNVAV